MPKKPIDYSKCCIYKICCKDANIKDEYIGHTTDIIRRKSQHKNVCNNSNSKDYISYIYQFIRANGGFENWDFIVIEEYPCENVFQAKLRERYWIENSNSTLNRCIPTRTIKEYQQNSDEYKNYVSKRKEGKIICECGIELKRWSYPKHLKSTFHINFINSKK